MRQGGEVGNGARSVFQLPTLLVGVLAVPPVQEISQGVLQFEPARPRLGLGVGMLPLYLMSIR